MDDTWVDTCGGKGGAGGDLIDHGMGSRSRKDSNKGDGFALWKAIGTGRGKAGKSRKGTGQGQPRDSPGSAYETGSAVGSRQRSRSGNRKNKGTSNKKGSGGSIVGDSGSYFGPGNAVNYKNEIDDRSSLRNYGNSNSRFTNYALQ